MTKIFNFKGHIIIATMVVIVFLSTCNLHKLIVDDMHNINVLQENEITLTIPTFTKKIRLDLQSDNNVCSKYIESIKTDMIIYDQITNSIIENPYYLDKYKKVIIKVRTDNKEIVDNNCTISLHISDPYGNMLKYLILVYIPILIIIYVVFKGIILWIDKNIKKARGSTGV